MNLWQTHPLSLQEPLGHLPEGHIRGALNLLLMSLDYSNSPFETLSSPFVIHFYFTKPWWVLQNPNLVVGLFIQDNRLGLHTGWNPV